MTPVSSTAKGRPDSLKPPRRAADNREVMSYLVDIAFGCGLIFAVVINTWLFAGFVADLRNLPHDDVR
jgi:hypothetical protein